MGKWSDVCIKRKEDGAGVIDIVKRHLCSLRNAISIRILFLVLSNAVILLWVYCREVKRVLS